MFSHQEVLSEIERLERSIQQKTRRISRSPIGVLQCHKDGNNFNWYVVTKEEGKKKRRYLPKSKRRLAEALAYKGLLEHELIDEQQELAALNMFMRNCSSFERGTRYVNRSDGYRNLIVKDNNWPIDIQEWLNNRAAVPEEMSVFDDGLKYRCRNGLLVRSKSEQLIVAALEYHKIPYKYEEPLKVNGYSEVPDFTILNPKTGKEIIWEHFGMMSDPVYFTKNRKKIIRYLDAGYIPFKDILMTFEEDGRAIDSYWIEKIIESFLQ